ncbi:hypothetical protein JNN96_36970 [Mycobacterium sp. DSM 3803]|nr:hypothetical protein [Mycobacterium sp. DSM 3803]
MGGNLEYNDGLARAGATEFEQVADALTRISSDVESELSTDSPWSHDKIGSSFSSQFDKPRSTVISNVKNFAQKVESYGPAITKAADGVVNTDRA